MLFWRKICTFMGLLQPFFSFMLVGDPFAGKTKVLNVLAQTLTLMTERGHGDENINKVQSHKVFTVVKFNFTKTTKLHE